MRAVSAQTGLPLACFKSLRTQPSINVKLLPQEFLLIDRFEVLHRPCVAFEHFVPAAAADFENHRAVADPAQGFAVRRTAHFDFSQRAGQPIGILKSLDELADRMEHG